MIEVHSDTTTVRCRLLDSRGRLLANADAPGHREFPEFLLLHPGTEPTTTLEVAIAGAGIPGGSYGITFYPVADLELRAWELLVRGGELNARGHQEGQQQAAELYRQAADAYQQAAVEWSRLGHGPRQAMADFFGGVIHYELGNKTAAVEMLTRAHRISSRFDPAVAADVLAYLGKLLYDMGHKPRSVRLLESALAYNMRAGRTYQMGIAQNILALIHLESGNLDEAQRLFREAAEHLESLGEIAELAKPVNNLGGFHYMRGEPDQALEYFAKYLRIARATDDLRAQADALHNIASLDKITGNFEQFLTRQFEIRAIRERLADPIGVARALHAIGVGYYDNGSYDKALTFLGQARQARAELGEKTVAETDRALGEVHSATGEFPAAIEAFARALELRRQAQNPTGIAQVELAIAQARLAEAKLAAAGPAAEILAEVTAAARAAVATFTDTGERRHLTAALITLGEAERLAQSPRARLTLERAVSTALEIRSPEHEIRARLLLAALDYEADDLDAAWSGVEQAVERVENSRATIRSAGLRATYLATQQQIFELRTDMRVERYLRSRRPEDAFAALVAHADAKSRTLREISNRRPSNGAARSDIDARRDRLHDRLATVTYWLQLALDNNNVDEIQALDHERVALTAQLDQLDEEDESQRRQTERILAERLDLDRARANLDRRTIVLVYALGQRRSFRWLVSASDLELTVLPPRDHIAGQVDAVYRFFRIPRFGSVDPVPREALTATLLSGLETRPEVERLLIVPDHVLFYLPFAALLEPSLRQDSMLIERYEIGLLPSAHFIDRHSRREREPPVNVVLVGDPATLPHVAVEIERIKALFPDAVSLLGPVATKREVIERMADARLLHFATHGFVDDRTPESSGLQLTDGLLLLPEIMASNLAAESVVLSACEGGVGKHVNGEGLIGLTYGFLAAGADRVVSSLWQVADRQTPEFMAQYYRHLRRGRSSLAALRAAQLEFLNNPRTRSPYYWASFAHFGNPH